MPYKPVGIDENSRFPPRVNLALSQMFVTKPVGIRNGEVPVWDDINQMWVGGSAASGGGGTLEWTLPPAIDGGVWDPATNAWTPGTGWLTPPPPPEIEPDIDGGTPLGD